ncbi:hypothetical protein HMPREF9714_00952 [Myroides odoratimimus CCUG 12901]|uniref:hypothetical protein n=2 Tax=Flavobacteriaceae TaxID=49546 RepID=UPI0002460D4C|nr:hypothetical protein [Myroides odoratimimus]EHO13118.1 hypothetical protein HMPREF9714_00952 [Myroides odoratimimus CCUG 12901]
MKHLIKNLLMPFAVVAMLSVGAFTMNASNKADNKIEATKIAESQTLYIGTLHYKVGSTYPIATIVDRKDCTLDETTVAYYEEVNNQQTRMYGWDSNLNDYRPLFEITEL